MSPSVHHSIIDLPFDYVAGLFTDYNSDATVETIKKAHDKLEQQLWNDRVGNSSTSPSDTLNWLVQLCPNPP